MAGISKRPVATAVLRPVNLHMPDESYVLAFRAVDEDYFLGTKDLRKEASKKAISGS